MLGLSDDKVVLHANIWYIYKNEKIILTKGGYYVEVSGSDGNKVLWEVLDDLLIQPINTTHANLTQTALTTHCITLQQDFKILCVNTMTRSAYPIILYWLQNHGLSIMFWNASFSVFQFIYLEYPHKLITSEFSRNEFIFRSN